MPCLGQHRGARWLRLTLLPTKSCQNLLLPLFLSLRPQGGGNSLSARRPRLCSLACCCCLCDLRQLPPPSPLPPNTWASSSAPDLRPCSSNAPYLSFPHSPWPGVGSAQGPAWAQAGPGFPLALQGAVENWPRTPPTGWQPLQEGLVPQSRHPRQASVPSAP